MKNLLILIFGCFSIALQAQEHSAMKDYTPSKEYTNVHVKKIAEDAHQTSYIIWVKDSVPEHYHADHTENIVVISGKAIMTLDGKEITIKKGDFLNIPEGTKHAVKEVLSLQPLKVLSIQTPMFDGKDRIYTKKEE